MSDPIPTLREYGEYLESLERPLDFDALLVAEGGLHADGVAAGTGFDDAVRDLDALAPVGAMVADPEPSRGERTGRRRWVVAAAAVVAAVVLIAGTVLLADGGHHAIRTKPAAPGPAPTTTTPPTTDPAAYAAVADSFMAAWVAGDGDGVVALIGDPITVEDSRFVDPKQPLIQVTIGSVEVPGGGVPGTATSSNWAFDDVAALPALHDWFRALGWQFRREPCRPFPSSMPEVADSADVVCNYTYENDLTRAVGRAPVTERFELMVVGDKVAGFGGGMFDLDADIWQMFSDWVRSEHPDDIAAMYYSGTVPPAPRLDKASIVLWDRHVGEFVSSPNAHTPAPGAPTRAQFGAQARMICATAAFETQEGNWGPPEGPETGAERASQRLSSWGPPGGVAHASQASMEQLRALPRPEEDAAQIDQLFSLLEEINRRVVADDWFHKADFYIMAVEKDRLGGRDFWGCPVGPLGG